MSSKDEIIHCILRYKLLNANYDGEGAETPNSDSITSAVDFVKLLSDKMIIPESMLNPNGNVGLFYETETFYVDLEFYPDNKISYFVKRNADKHRGNVLFNHVEIPQILLMLLTK